MKAILFVAMVIGMAPLTLVAQDDRPAFRPFRYDEDWNSLADPSHRSEWLDRLKYIGLGKEGWFVTLGAEIREKFEVLDQPGFGLGPYDPYGYLLQRYLLFVRRKFWQDAETFPFTLDPSHTGKRKMRHEYQLVCNGEPL